MKILSLFALFSVLFQSVPAGSFAYGTVDVLPAKSNEAVFAGDEYMPEVVICPDCPQPLPVFVVIVEDAEVHGSPKVNSILLKTLKYGDHVRARDVGRGSGDGWIMIAPAEWVKIADLERYIP